MIFAYIRVSIDKQSNKNQRFELTRFAEQRHWAIDTWVEEPISVLKKLEGRKLHGLLQHH